MFSYEKFERGVIKVLKVILMLATIGVIFALVSCSGKTYKEQSKAGNPVQCQYEKRTKTTQSFDY